MAVGVAARYIPFERRVIVRRGTAHDLDDAIVKAAPEMFRDLDGGLFGVPMTGRPPRRLLTRSRREGGARRG